MNIFLKKKIAVLTLVLALCVGGGFLATPQFAYAEEPPTTTPPPPPTTDQQQNQQPPATSTKNVVTSIVGWIVVALVWTLGQIMVVLMYLLLWIASYNDFINSPAVTNGWVILRDVCNMFFVLILLVIAFATVLNRENYAMKKLLPKFIIAAILINFSRLICGIIIDFAQVIMLTFVNGFRDIGGGNLADMLGISGYLSMNADSDQRLDTLTIVGTYILALLYSIIATVVVGTMVFVLVVRMVMIWIYVVLSPMPYLLSILPATEKYASKWWDDFTKNVASGPILAFFIWLSFASVQPDSTGASLINGATVPNSGENETTKLKGFESSGAGAPEAGISQSGSSDSMLKFIISIGLLMGGLMITKELGGAVGAVAGGAFDKIKGAAKGVRSLATRPVRERWQAFQGQREAVRKAKVQKFGEQAFSTYSNVKGGIKGVGKGAVAGMKGLAGEATDRLANKLVQSQSAGSRSLGRGIQGFKAGVAEYQQKRQEKKAFKVKAREEQTAYRNRLQEAYTTGVYTNERGEKFDEEREYRNPDGSMSKTYVRKMKDAEGNDLVDPFGNQRYEEATRNGHRVEKMSKSQFGALNAWNNSMKDARAYSNPKETENIKKEQKKMEDAGFTIGQLQTTLRDATADSTQRMAAAMTLAVKEGFKSKEDIGIAQTLMKDTKNTGLMKDFNDTVDKKQAHLNFDLSDETERRKFAKRRQDGKFDVLQDGAYKDENVVKALSDSMTEDEFMNYTRRVSNTSSKHDESQKAGFRSYLDTHTPAYDEDDELDKTIKAIKHVTKNTNDGLRAHANNPAEVQKILNLMVEDMSSQDVVKLDVASFKPDTKLFTTPESQTMYKDNLVESLQSSFTKEQLHKMQTNPNGKAKTKKAMVELFREYYARNRNNDNVDQRNNPFANAPIPPFQATAAAQNPAPETPGDDDDDDDDDDNQNQ